MGLLHSRAHSGGHDALAALGGLGPSVLVLKGFLELDALDVLLVFDFLLDVLVSLEQFVVLGLPQLESLVQVGLQFLLEGVHFVLLLLNKLGLRGNNFLLSLFHVFLTLFSL